MKTKLDLDAANKTYEKLVDDMSRFLFNWATTNCPIEGGVEHMAAILGALGTSSGMYIKNVMAPQGFSVKSSIDLFTKKMNEELE